MQFYAIQHPVMPVWAWPDVVLWPINAFILIKYVKLPIKTALYSNKMPYICIVKMKRISWQALNSTKRINNFYFHTYGINRLAGLKPFV